MNGSWISVLNASAASWAPAIWRATWQGGLFVVAVWLICRIFRQMPASTRSWLWWLASLQMLLRLVIVAPLALPILPAEQTRDISTVATKPSSSITKETFAPSEAAQPALNVGASVKSSDKAFTEQAPNLSAVTTTVTPTNVGTKPESLSLAAWLMSVWLLGMLACAAISIRRLLGTRRLLRDAQAIHDGAAYEAVQEFSIDHGIRLPRLLEAESALCPLLAGWLKPAIVLPTNCESTLAEDQLRMAIAHEFAHIKRRDLWLGIAPAITQTLFFFHPCVWLAAHEGAAAREAACDGEALRISGGSPAAYARLLLDTAQSRSSMAVLGAAFGFRLIHRRISMLKTITGSNARRYRSAGALLLALGAVCAMPWTVTAQTAPPAAPKASAPSHKHAPRPPKPPVKSHAHTSGHPPVPPAPQRTSTPVPPAPAFAAARPFPSAPPAAHPPRPTGHPLNAPPAPMFASAASNPFGVVNAPPPFAPTNPAPMAVMPASARPHAAIPPLSKPIPFAAGASATPAPAAFPGGQPAQPSARASVTTPDIKSTIDRDDRGAMRIHFRNVEIHKALETFFEAHKLNYILKSGIEEDTVSCSLTGVPTETALDMILRSVKQPLTYRLEADVYVIFSKGKD